MKQLLVFCIKGYRLLLSPWLGNSCRFEPTCSVYAMQALERHGALAGSYLAAGRLLRCHPWCQGGCDPVPGERPRLFRHLAGTPGHHAASPAAPSSPDETSSPYPHSS